MIDKIPMGTTNLDKITKKLREVIEAVNPVIEAHKAPKGHTHTQFHMCPKCGYEYFIHLSSRDNYEGYRVLLQCCNCRKTMTVNGSRGRRYEIIGG